MAPIILLNVCSATWQFIVLIPITFWLWVVNPFSAIDSQDVGMHSGYLIPFDFPENELAEYLPVPKLLQFTVQHTRAGISTPMCQTTNLAMLCWLFAEVIWYHWNVWNILTWYFKPLKQALCKMVSLGPSSTLVQRDRLFCITLLYNLTFQAFDSPSTSHILFSPFPPAIFTGISVAGKVETSSLPNQAFPWFYDIYISIKMTSRMGS